MSPLNDPREALRRALQYDAGDPKRIQHLIKVYAFAEMIADGEHLPDAQRRVLLTAAALHDIGIHNAQLHYGSSAGKYQELEGPPVVCQLLATGQRILWKKFVIWWPDTIPTPVWTD